MIGDAKLEIDVNFEVLVREYRLKINGEMDDLLAQLKLNFDNWKIDVIDSFNFKRNEFTL